MKKFLFYGVLIFSTAHTYAKEQTCQLKLAKEDLCVEVEFLKPVTRKEDAKFFLRFRDKAGKKIKPKFDIDVYLWMRMKNGHEHGSEKVKIQQQKDHYLISNVWFLMLGNWSLNIRLLEANKKVKDQGKIDFCLEKDPQKSHFGQCK